MNTKNYELYRFFIDEHIKDGGNSQQEYALTELILNSIKLKDYKIYYGGGYEYETEKRIELYDVVALVQLTGDVLFFVCLDDLEGDSCILYRCTPECIIEKIIK